MTSPEPPPPSYGSAPPPGGYQAFPPGGYQQHPQDNQLALWSMISGIASIPMLCLCGTGFFVGITALVLGIVARGQIGKTQGMQSGNGQALAGIILGSVAIALTIVYAIGMFTFGMMGSFGSYGSYGDY